MFELFMGALTLAFIIGSLIIGVALGIYKEWKD